MGRGPQNTQQGATGKGRSKIWFFSCLRNMWMGLLPAAFSRTWLLNRCVMQVISQFMQFQQNKHIVSNTI